MNLNNLNKNQLEAVEAKEGCYCVISAAGSGKTKVLTTRIAKLIEDGINPSSILSVTFTSKAAKEMKSRLHEIIGEPATRVKMGTFHSICFEILRIETSRFKTSIIPKDWWINKTIEDVIKPYIKKGFDLKVSQILSWIGYQKNYLIKPDGKLLLPENWLQYDFILRHAYEYYESEKIKNNYLDFDDMLICCYELLKNNKNIKEKYQNIYHYILIDEYQDTCKAQDKIIQMLGAKYNNVFVVGDFRQSLYSWRASNINIIQDFDKTWKNAKIIHLDKNYRSTKNIVDWSNKLIGISKDKYKHYKDSIANRDEYKDPIVICSSDENEEARNIVNEIKTLQDKYVYEDMTILYRTNAQSRAFEDALISERVPYIVLSGLSFYNRKEIKDMIAYLQLIYDHSNDDALCRILNIPNRFLGKAFLDNLNKYAVKNKTSLYDALLKCPESDEWRYKKGTSEFIDIIEEFKDTTLSPGTIIKKLTTILNYNDYLLNVATDEESGREKVENIIELSSIATKYTSLETFLNYIKIVSNQNDSQNEYGKVKLMTIHKSKGLEFPIVFVASINDGILPHKKSSDDEEERRILYVAMTRAKDLLYLSYVKQYNNKPILISNFMRDLLSEEEINKL